MTPKSLPLKKNAEFGLALSLIILLLILLKINRNKKKKEGGDMKKVTVGKTFMTLLRTDWPGKNHKP